MYAGFYKGVNAAHIAHELKRMYKSAKVALQNRRHKNPGISVYLKAFYTMKFVTIVAAAAFGLAQAKDPYGDWHKPSKGDGMEP